MERQYREMFDEVRASDELRMEVLQMSNQENRNRGRRRLRAAGLVAAVLAAVLATSALAVAASPTLRDWFARQWGERTGGEIRDILERNNRRVRSQPVKAALDRAGEARRREREEVS